MSAAQDFRGKNALRRLFKAEAGSVTRRRYNQARQLRRQLLTDGAFGRLDGQLYTDLAIGTYAQTIAKKEKETR